MKTDLEIYREKRDHLLANMTEILSQDDRFVAGWLTGSLASGQADPLSDIDISIVVANLYSETFCQRGNQPMSQTSAERYSLFSRFGTPALIHENKNNAPAGGTFTFVLYSDTAVIVDWTLIPQSLATRPYPSKLLFDRGNIPFAPAPEPEGLEESKRAVAEDWAFFWMMAAITIKYMIRDDGVFVTQWLENLHGILRDIERRLHREPRTYTRGSLSQLSTTPEKQIQSIRELIQMMQNLRPKVSEYTGYDPAIPTEEIERLLSFAQDNM